ncbi:MAG: MFS transporter [bacterium]
MSDARSTTPAPTPAGGPAADPGATHSKLSHRQILIIFSGLMLGMFLSALDNTIVTTALTSIVGDLGGQSQATWVVTSYLLTSTITILMWGRLSDIYGRKLLFQISIGAFLGASALVGLANSMTFLVLARGLQGIGAGGIMSLAFAIIGDILSPRERGKYMGLMGSVFLFAMIIGPLLGGLIVEHMHIGNIAPWRWVFYINIPIGIPALFITGIVLRLPFHKQPGKIDFLGFGLMALGTCSLILGLLWAGQPASWDQSYNLRWFPGVGDAAPIGGVAPSAGVATFLGDWVVTILLAVGVVVTTLFVYSQAKVKQPLLPLSLFRHRTYALGSFVSFVVGAAMFGGFVFLPTYLQMSTGVSETLSGLLMLPLMAGMFPAMTISGILVSKTGRYKIWPLIGLPVGAGGLLWLSTIGASTPLWYTGFGMFLLGAGIGFTMQVIVVAVQNVLEPRQLGIGTSANTFMRQIGGVVGIGLFGAYYASRIIALIPKALAAAAGDPTVDLTPIKSGFRVGPEAVHQYHEPLHSIVTGGFADTIAHIFLFAAPVMLLGWVAVFFLKEIPLRQTRSVGGAAAMEGGHAPDAPSAPASTPSPTPAAPVLAASVTARNPNSGNGHTNGGGTPARPSHAIAPTPHPSVTLRERPAQSAYTIDELHRRVDAIPHPTQRPMRRRR